MTQSNRMPVVYLPHGGGPWPFVEMGLPKAEVLELAGYLKTVSAVPKTAPKALLVVSAHWEEAVPTVMTSAHPPMLYDYYGFPPESYTITWPAPGDPALAARVTDLLKGAGFETGTDAKRGFDHGSFVPLKLAYPNAEIPTVQLSLRKDLDPAAHLAMGRALAPLRDDGVFIITTGMTFHNMRAFRNASGLAISEAFDKWLQESVTLPSRERDARLVEWTSAPSARQAHPREEHLLPLMVAAGAAGADVGTVTYSGMTLGVKISGYQFG